MSYQVLARKWRPKRFAELVGQEHVVRALTHALETGRIHHAFLFTGTRGVGKTTIARIFAKSLNCDRGVTAEPCGECAVCRDVDIGRFADLLEIDAASNTGVDDVRVVIENAQYVPSRGRYKVYLIDEVHMLSKNAFNALLKTLEEPPPHVKFLLATTDPQKLPITVLSRCLQFNLRRLSDEQIEGQLVKILAAEGIATEPVAVREIARGGNGSLRDALSLLDQAIAYGGGSLRDDDVRAMLGTIDRSQVVALLDAIIAADAAALMAGVEAAAAFAPEFSTVLDELALLLHRVQLAQLLPRSDADIDPLAAAAREFASRIAAEELQVLYQMALIGRRDLGMAPSPRVGFEMTLLRMLAFRPSTSDGGGTGGKRTEQRSVPSASVPGASGNLPRTSPVAAPSVRPGMAAPAPVPMPAAAAVAPAVVTLAHSVAEPQVPAAAFAGGAGAPISGALDAASWPQLLAGLSLRGPVRELAANTALLSFSAGELRLALSPELGHLRSDILLRQLTQALEPQLGATLKIKLELANGAGETAAAIERRAASERQQTAEMTIAGDPVIQSLIETFDARVVPNTTRAV